jgi:hypothetical protein
LFAAPVNASLDSGHAQLFQKKFSHNIAVSTAAISLVCKLLNFLDEDRVSFERVVREANIQGEDFIVLASEVTMVSWPCKD